MSAAFLVTGATGHQGGSAARELLKSGAKVHAFVRDPSKPAAKELEALGAVLFVGDFSDSEAIQKATEGVKGVFINPYPDFTNLAEQVNQVQRFVDAAKAAGTVETVVLSTLLSTPYHEKWLAEDPEYLFRGQNGAKWEAENRVRKAGFAHYTILRPSFLLHNYYPPLSALFYDFLPEGEMQTVIRPEIPIPHLDGADVGVFAAAALLNPERFSGKEIPLGLANISTTDVVREIDAAVGSQTTITFVDPAPLMKDPSNAFAFMRGLVGTWTNQQDKMHMTDAEFELQNSFGISLTPIREWAEKNKGSLAVNFKPSASS